MTIKRKEICTDRTSAPPPFEGGKDLGRRRMGKKKKRTGETGKWSRRERGSKNKEEIRPLKENLGHCPLPEISRFLLC